MQAGLIGLGPMGRNLALNLRDAGHEVLAWDPWPQARAWRAEGISVVDDVAGLVENLEPSRIVLLMIKAGEPVISQARGLMPLLAPGDIVMDGGNSHYEASEELARELGSHGIGFLGLGISGGAEGARKGPAIMAGGDEAAWLKAEPLLASIAAKAGGEPCLDWFGSGGAGHFIKMVHNGIEYAVMQAIAEAAEILIASGHSAAEAGAVMRAWLKGSLAGYLLEISAEILATVDGENGSPIIDVISDRAGHKGTGTWCTRAGLDFGVPVPCIAEAVAMRQLSASEGRRRLETSSRMVPHLQSRPDATDIEAALGATILVAFEQGFHLLAVAARERGWTCDRSRVARVWRQGSILRMRLLEEVITTGDSGPLLSAPGIRRRVDRAFAGWCGVTVWGLCQGLAVPVMASGLAYLNGVNSAKLPTALIQAQRDRFGDHGFERTDRPGSHHGPWRDVPA